MSIQQHTGDLLAQQDILVHGCNCMGVMGGGVAEHIRKKYPFAFHAYEHRYDVFGLQLGDIVAVANPAMRTRFPDLNRHISQFHDSIPDGTIVVNAMTQYDYGRDEGRVYVDYPAVEAAFVRVRMVASVTGQAVHFPLIGCGLAKGKWSEVGPRIERGLNGTDANLWLMPGATVD